MVDLVNLKVTEVGRRRHRQKYHSELQLQYPHLIIDPAWPLAMGGNPSSKVSTGPSNVPCICPIELLLIEVNILDCHFNRHILLQLALD